MPHVEVKTPDSVDVAHSAELVQSGAVTDDLSMEDYAAAREAEMRGEKPAVPIQSEEPGNTSTETKAAATEQSAAAAEGQVTENDDPEGEAQIDKKDWKPKNGIQRRLYAEREEARAELAKAKQAAEEAKAEAERIRAEAEAVKKAAEAATKSVPDAEDDPIPQREQFDDPDAYVAALAAHATRTEIRRANEEAAKQRAESERQEQEARQAEAKKRAEAQIVELHKTFNERVVKAREELPDYDEKVTNNESLQLRNDVFFMIEQAELAPYLLHHIASNPDLATSLNQLSPQGAAIRLGEIQAEIRATRKPQVSRAAEPVKPVGARQSPQRKTPNEETMEEYAARREDEMRQEQAKRHPRRANGRL